MIVVSNTTPLIGLSLLGRFELLQALFSEVAIPSAVYNELVVQGAGRVGANEVANGVNEGWMHVETVASTSVLATLKIDLDEGEAEAIALAFERPADLLLMDEHKGRGKDRARANRAAAPNRSHRSADRCAGVRALWVDGRGN